MTIIEFIILLITLNAIFDITIVIVIFIFILAMAFIAKPLQRLFKVSQAIEVIVWFSLLFLYASIFVLLNS